MPYVLGLLHDLVLLQVHRFLLTSADIETTRLEDYLTSFERYPLGFAETCGWYVGFDLENNH
jgi:hypothetical protein